MWGVMSSKTCVCGFEARYPLGFDIPGNGKERHKLLAFVFQMENHQFWASNPILTHTRKHVCRRIIPLQFILGIPNEKATHLKSPSEPSHRGPRLSFG